MLTSIKEACATLRSAVDSLDECDMGELDLSEKATLAVAKHSLSAVVKSIKIDALHATYFGRADREKPSLLQIATSP